MAYQEKFLKTSNGIMALIPNETDFLILTQSDLPIRSIIIWIN